LLRSADRLRLRPPTHPKATFNVIRSALRAQYAQGGHGAFGVLGF
jgi:hypothetical protein